MIAAMKKSYGIVSTACESVGINRTTHYNWLHDDPEYKREIEAIDEANIDFAESKLKQLIDEGDTTATIFFLKTKGKRRGYIEKTEVDNTVKFEDFDISKAVTFKGDSSK